MPLVDVSKNLNRKDNNKNVYSSQKIYKLIKWQNVGKKQSLENTFLV